MRITERHPYPHELSRFESFIVDDDGCEYSVRDVLPFGMYCDECKQCECRHVVFVLKERTEGAGVMATKLSPNMRAALALMAAGHDLIHHQGWGNRIAATAYIYPESGHVSVRMSTFNALRERGLIHSYKQEWARYYYRVTDAGKAAVQ